MAFIGDFNAAEVDTTPNTDFSPLPQGEYVVIITNSEMKQNSKKNGEYLLVEMDVVEGEYSNRKLFVYLNLKNPNEVAQKIGYQDLAKICKAVGKEQIKDSSELHGKRFVAHVVVEQGSDYVKDGVTREGKPQNAVKGYSAWTGTKAESASPVAAAGGSKPWAR